MKDKEYEAVRDFIRPIAHKWLDLMGLGWDDIDLCYKDSYFSMDVEGHSPTSAAFVVADWRYLHASVYFSCAKIGEEFADLKPKDPAYVTYIIMHELAHILVNEMQEWRHDTPEVSAMKHEERVVTRIARAFQHTYDTAFKAGLEQGSKRRKRGK